MGPTVQGSWPMKSGDSLRSGKATATGPFDIDREPTWTFKEPTGYFESKKFALMISMRCFHCSPIIDEDGNTLICSTQGIIFSINKQGEVRWRYRTTGMNPINPAVKDGILYTTSDDGMAWAIRCDTGEQVWSSRVGLRCPTDTASAVVAGDVVILPATPEQWHPEVTKDTSLLGAIRSDGSFAEEDVVAVNIKDGSVSWRFSLAAQKHRVSYNITPAVVDDDVVFHDITGGVYRVRLTDGSLVWYEEGLVATSFTTGGACVGPNGVVYSGFCRQDCAAGGGVVRAHSGADGRVLWTRQFDQGINATPAVGTLASGRLAVIVAEGANTNVPHSLQALAAGKFCALLAGVFLKPLGLYTSPFLRPLVGRILALDAETGETIWTFTTPILEDDVSAGSTVRDLNVPDQWGAPSIGGDGTVYAGWSGGEIFALRDANGDGIVDASNPDEVRSFHTGYGCNSNTAIIDGMVVAASTKSLYAWSL